MVTKVARWQWLPYGEVLSDMAMEVWLQLHTKSTIEGKDPLACSPEQPMIFSDFDRMFVLSRKTLEHSLRHTA